MKQIVIFLLIISVLGYGSYRYISSQTPAPNIENYATPIHGIEDIISLPKPVDYPFPRINKLLIGTTVKLQLTINKEGQATAVRLEKPLEEYPDDNLLIFAGQLRVSVSKWKFSPALDQNSEPIAVNVLMPVHVTKNEGSPTALVSLLLDESKDTQ